MKETLNQWLVERANLPGTLAAGLVHADQTVFTHFYSRSFASILKDGVWPALTELLRTMAVHDMNAPHVRWLFQNAYVYGAAREDGSCAFIITSRNLSSEDAGQLENFGTEFQSL